jgi:hypothetical protein
MDEIKHASFEIPHELNHLSLEKVREIAQAYHDKTARPSDLIRKYKIEGVKNNALGKLLPPRENMDYSCPVHNLYSWQNSVGKIFWSEPYCPECGEKLVTELPLDYFDRYLEKIWSQVPHQKIMTNLLPLETYKQLPLRIKAFLATWFVDEPNHRTFKLEAQHLDSFKICPTKTMKEAYIEQLNHFNLLKTNQYLLQEIELHENLIPFFESHDFCLEARVSEYFDLWWEIAYNEVLEYFLSLMEENNFRTTVGPKTTNVLQYAIKNLSIQDSFNVTWRAVQDGCSTLAKSKGDFSYASNIIPSKIKTRTDQFLKGELKVMLFKRIKSCSQSALSKFYSEDMTFLYDLEFTECPNLHYFIANAEGKKWIVLDIPALDGDFGRMKTIGELLRESDFLNGRNESY